MSIYDISAESSFKVLNYILIMWGNMLINVTKFIIKIYNSVELFILDTQIYDKFNNDYLTNPIPIVLLTLSIILLCNLINKKFNEIVYIENLDSSNKTCVEINLEKNKTFFLIVIFNFFLIKLSSIPKGTYVVLIFSFNLLTLFFSLIEAQCIKSAESNNFF